MNGSPLLSVATVTYNHKKYIAQTIESVLMQECEFDYEMVIGEDCSTDGTREIVKKYESDYPEKIRIITSDKNVGMAKNGIRTEKACRGKYLCFLDGDDFFSSPHKLQKQIGFMEGNRDFGMVHSNYNRLFEQTGKIYRDAKKQIYDREVPSGSVFEELLVQNFIATATTCIRRDLLNRYFDHDEFVENGFLARDYAIWLDIAANSKVGYINKSLSTYRIRRRSASHFEKPNSVLKFYQSTHAVQIYYMQKYGCSDQTKRIVKYNYYKGLLRLAHQHRWPELALSAYRSLESMTHPSQRLKKEFYFYWMGFNSFTWFITKCYFKIRNTLLITKRS